MTDETRQSPAETSHKGREKYRVNPLWRCFFCDEIFTTRGLAAEHFGTEVGCDYPLPACQIKEHEGHLVHYIRQLEEELGVWRKPRHPNAIVALEGEFADKVRRADDGFARGVADMKKQGSCVEPEKHAEQLNTLQRPANAVARGDGDAI